jgi:hypothetical protein
MPRPPNHLPARSLAARVGALALTLGALVAGWAAVTGNGSCAAARDLIQGNAAFLGVDDACYALVRTMSFRVGVAVAVATAIVVLTMVGLARLASVSSTDPLEAGEGLRPSGGATR